MHREIFGWDYPAGVRTNMIPGCRPQDVEHDRNVTLTVDELDQLAQVGTIPDDMIAVIYEQLMEGWEKK